MEALCSHIFAAFLKQQTFTDHSEMASVFKWSYDNTLDHSKMKTEIKINITLFE